MRNTLFGHQLAGAKRSPIFAKDIGIKILMGFLFFIIFLELFGGGFYLGSKLAEESSNPLVDIIKYGFYFFGSVMLMRFALQKLPTMAVTPYLLLPVKKSKLVNFVLTKPLFNILNLLPFALVLPLLLGIRNYITSGEVLIIFATLLVCDLFVNYLTIYIKRIQIKYESVFYIFLAATLSFVLLDSFNIVDFSALSADAFGAILSNPLWLLAPVVLLIGAYYLNFNLLINHFTLEDFGKSESKNRGSLETVTYLQRFGKIGEFMLLEMKMIVRNKRTRTLLLMAPLFLLYGMFFYTNPTYKDMGGFLIFVGLFITGGFIMSFGLYFFAWESGHFDLVLTANNSYSDYVKAKYYLMVGSAFVMFLLSIPYAYFGVNILLINTVSFLFNVGVNTLLLLYFATNNEKHMDLSKGSAFNYQGVSGRHFVLMFPLLVGPMLIYAPFSLAGFPTVGLLVIGFLGLIGIIFNEKLLALITDKFISRRHRMAEGFRQK